MKSSELREIDQEELSRKLADLKSTLFNLRFQHSTDQLENPRKLRHTRRDIARVKTILREKRKPE